MTSLRLILTTFALTTVAALGCASKTSSDSADTNTNWLKTCVDKDDCGSGLSCLCGVCSETCVSNKSCRDLPSDAICRTEEDACGIESVSLCARSDTKLGDPDNGSGGGSGGSGNGNGQDDAGSPGGKANSGDSGTPRDAGSFGGAGAGGESNGGAGGSLGGAGGAPAVECTVPQGVAFPAEAYDPPTGCDLPFGDVQETWVTNEAEFKAAFACADGITSGVDFATRQVYIAVVSERTEAALNYVQITPTSDIVVGITSPIYCGGPPPPNTPVAVVMDKSLRVPSTTVCTTGKCEGPPKP